MYTGIDLGSRYIRAVELDARGEKINLLRAAIAPTPEGAIEEGRIRDLDKLAVALDKLLSAEQFVADRIAMSVFNPLVLVRRTRIPLMPEGQLKRTLLWEAKSLISFPPEDATIEYQVISPPEGEQQQVDVIFAVVPTAMIEERVILAERLRLELTALDVEPFAIQRALVDISEVRRGENLAILHTGGSYSTMLIVEKGKFTLTRALPATKERKEEDRDRLMREVRRFLDFYRAQYGEESGGGEVVNRLIVSGSRQDLAEFSEYLGKSLGIPCEVASIEREQFDARSKETALNNLLSSYPLFVVAFGLAMRERIAILEGVAE
ncbi:pilus assembly protein PilM [bacterium]|nr:pilus assembly protein PilM [bacterium]